MDIIHTTAELRARLAHEDSVALVPTMGNLHEGHMQLARIARQRAACTVVSIFVNRLQFGPREDFDRYPRTLPQDSAKCSDEGVDVIFAPDETEMYPEPQTCVVDPGGIQDVLEGAVRPGHFRGVATVVMKLFNQVQPDLAVFGKKDYQQCKVIASMVRQLALPLQLELAETTRASDGLALSSRNGYLSATERSEAPVLYQQLQGIAQRLMGGDRRYAQVEGDSVSRLSQRGWQPDYIAIRRQHDLAEPGPDDRHLVVLVAARLGTTRLIDNLEISL